jgi:hypothetical protein
VTASLGTAGTGQFEVAKPYEIQQGAGQGPLLLGWGMAKKTTKKMWTKPEFKRLGEIKDVAGHPVPGPQSLPSHS